MALKSLTGWVEETGISPPPWINGDGKAVMNLLSRLLVDSLVQRKQYYGMEDSTFKISFNSMQQLSEEVLGIPFVIVEADLRPSSPSIHLAALAAVICIKSSTLIAPKVLEQMVVPKIEFEMEDGGEADIAVPNCALCLQHVYFIERVIAQRKIYHRKCFVCSVCGEVLHRFSQRDQEGTYECYKHLPNTLLAVKWDKSEHRKKPQPPPKPISLRSQLDMTCSKNHGKLKETDTSLCKFETLETRPVPHPRKTLASVDVTNETALSTNNSETRPIPPPRPKRKSLLERLEQESASSTIRSDSCSVTSRSVSSTEDILQRQSMALCISVVDYPGFLNPFGSDDEDCTSDTDDYDSSLNPFDISRDDRNALDELSYAASLNRCSSNPMASHNRPKSPPPPPPKPPRAMRSSFAEISSSRPLDHHDTMDKFTEESCDNMSVKCIDEFLDALNEKLDSTEIEGRLFEMELLDIMEKNGSEWMKNDYASQWITVFEKHCSLLRQQTVCVKKWMEKFLDKIHAETELELRNLIENEGEKSSEEVGREAALLELLVNIINQKSSLVESKMVESNSANKGEGTQINVRKSTKRIKTRLKKLKKRLSRQGKSAA